MIQEATDETLKILTETRKDLYGFLDKSVRTYERDEDGKPMIAYIGMVAYYINTGEFLAVKGEDTFETLEVEVRDEDYFNLKNYFQGK